MAGLEGRIYKGIGGFYYVKADDGRLLECKPRGIFRKRGEKPLAGDRVVLGEEANFFVIDEISPRHNRFVRPPVANVDQLFIVASTDEPAPNLLVIDKLAAFAFEVEASPIIIVSKPDLADSTLLSQAYATSGIPLVVASAITGEGLDVIKTMLKDKLSVFSGNSGVGKSTLLNAIAPAINRATGEISRKLGRGRHTTREVEIFEVEGGLVADTPGFASFDVQCGEAILANNMQLCFPEIKSRIGQCRFSGCTHLQEVGCAIIAAVKDGDISQSRYDSYVTLFQQAKEAQREY